MSSRSSHRSTLPKDGIQPSSSHQSRSPYIRPKYLTSACARCKRLQVRCRVTDDFPCQGCVDAGLGDVCSASPRKSRGVSTPPSPSETTREGFGCRQCRVFGLSCEPLSFPCDNCVERGRATNCDQSGQVKAIPTGGYQQEGIRKDANYNFAPLASRSDASKPELQPIELDLPPLHQATAPLTPITHENEVQNAEKIHPPLQSHLPHLLLSVVEFLQLVSMIFLPKYYATQAAPLLECAAKCNEDYRRWTSECECLQADYLSHYDSLGSQADTERSAPLRGLPNVVEPVSHVVLPDATIDARVLFQLPPMPISVEKLCTTWNDYLESRKVEWNVLMSIAVLFIATSPTIFQIPAASSDPVIRMFTFLAICRAIAGVLFGPIFSVHFRTCHATSVHYAHFWVQQSQCLRSPTVWGPWILISLPATATIWSLILFVCAIFSFIWRTDASAGNTLVRRTHDTASTFGIRGAITLVFSIDLIYIAWALWTLQKYKDACLAKKISTGT